MLDVAGGLLFQGVYAFPYENVTGAASYQYLPTEPQPEMDPQGRPAFSFIATGMGGFLRLGAKLVVSEQTLSDVRQELATRLKVDAPLLVLSEASFQVKGASLQRGDGTGNYVEISRSDTSGSPPYTAQFELETGAEGRTAATAALEGREGFLRVSYRGRLLLPVQARARIWGDARGLLTELRSVPQDAASQFAPGLIEAALSAGTLGLDRETSESAPEELLTRSIEEAKERLAGMLVQARHGVAELPEQVKVEGVAALEDWVEQQEDLVSDVAGWFGGRGEEHLEIIP